MPEPITQKNIVNVLRLLDLSNTNPTMLGHSVYTGYKGDHCLVGEILTKLGYGLPSATSIVNSATVEDLVVAFLKAPVSILGLRLLQGLQSFSDDGISWADTVAIVVGDLENAA